MKALFLLLSFFFFTSFSTTPIEKTASLQLNEGVQQAHGLVLDFCFDEASSALQTQQKLQPQNAALDYVKCYSSLFQYLNTEDESLFTRFENEWEIALERIENTNPQNPLRNYLLADLYLQSAFANALKSNYLTAIFKFRSAYFTIVENQEKFPKFIPNQKALGILNIGLGSIPKSFDWVMSILQMKGNIKVGLKQLEAYFKLTQSQSQYRYLLPEALLLYSFSQSNYGGKINPSHPLWVFYDKDTDSQLFQHQLNTFSKVSFFQHLKHNQKALDAIERIENLLQTSRYHLHFLRFMQAECYLYKGEPQAISHFQHYLKEYPGQNYKRAAHQKIAWIYLMNGQQEAYAEQMKWIKQQGMDVMDSDKQALKEAQSAQKPNPYLLRSRLYFDGGYYSKADTVLRQGFTKGQFHSPKDRLEYIYRLARIYDEQENAVLAEIYYRQTIEEGKDKPFYFAANAALLLGNYFEEMGNKKEAAKLYQMCLQMEYDEYQNGISQKAKAGLNRLK